MPIKTNPIVACQWLNIKRNGCVDATRITKQLANDIELMSFERNKLQSSTRNFFRDCELDSFGRDESEESSEILGNDVSRPLRVRNKRSALPRMRSTLVIKK